MTIKTISVPDIGGATDVDVLEVLVKVGDLIKVDAPLISIESDKATMEVPSPFAGTVKELKVKPGSKVSAGSAILTLEVSSETVAVVKKEVPSETPKAAATQQKTAAIQPAVVTAAPVGEGGEVHAGPLVRRLAREFGVNLTQVAATGPKGRILKDDVQIYVKTRLGQSAASGNGLGVLPPPVVDFKKFGEVESVALSRIKKLSGKNLQRNWVSIPHVTQFDEADITGLEAYRQSQKTELEKEGIKLTPLVFIMKAVVSALKKFPNFNASLDASGENLMLKKYFHIGVAVDTPEGLVVPVIRDVDQKSFKELAKELSVLSEKARNKQLTGNDMQGGCFSISSLGGIGGTLFTPIINMPEVAILGVSKSQMKPVYEKNQFVPKLMLPLSLSYDHRVIDGAEGARFMVYLTNTLSDIQNLLLN